MRLSHVGDGWGRRVVALLIVIFAFGDVVAWVYLFHRKPAQSSYVSRVTSSGLPPLNATPTPSATPSATSVQPLSLPKPANQTLNLSIVGDSLGTGRYASGPTARYRDLVIAALQKRGPVNPEEATASGASSLSTAKTVPPGLDLVVLEIGSDDIGLTSADAFATDYDALIKAVRAGSPQAALVCTGTWSADGAAYDAVIQRDCTAAKGRYVTLRAGFNVASNRGPAGVSGFYGVSDDIAPNDAGHRAIAGAILKEIGLGLS